MLAARLYHAGASSVPITFTIYCTIVVHSCNALPSTNLEIKDENANGWMDEGNAWVSFLGPFNPSNDP